MDAAEPRPPLGVLSLIAESFRLLGRNFAQIFPLAFVPALVVSAIAALVEPSVPMVPDPGDGMQGYGADAMTGLIELLVGTLVTGVLCLAAIDAVIGKRHSARQYVAQTWRYFLPILVLGLLVSIGAGVGLALLILPGLYVIGRYFVYVPAIVFEGAGWWGVNRAEELTRGYRWPLAGAVLLLGLIVVAVVMVAFLLFSALIGEAGPLAVLVDATLSAFGYSLIAIFTALVYARLRAIKEGLSPADIAGTIG